MAVTCSACRKTVEGEGVAFCPYCGARLSVPSAPEIGAEEQKLLNEVRSQDDPVKKHRLIEEGLARFPDSFSLHEEALYLGRLWQRDGRRLDFSVIKCHLLHIYLTPGEFTAQQRADKRNELFHDTDLEACKRISGRGDEFTAESLRKLSAQFTDLFLKGSNTYNRTFFGFHVERNADRALSSPAAGMVTRMHGDTELSAEERDMLCRAFCRGYTDALGSGACLREALDKAGLGMYME